MCMVQGGANLVVRLQYCLSSIQYSLLSFYYLVLGMVQEDNVVMV